MVAPYSGSQTSSVVTNRMAYVTETSPNAILTRRPSVDLIVDQRLRRWTSMKSTLI